MLIAPGLAGAGTVTTKGIKNLAVTGHGIGHGHGLSQYGARGAALRGLSTAAILAFYYPHTTLKTGVTKTVRVKITDDGTDTQVAAEPGVTATGVTGPLPTAGVTRYRFLPSATAGKLDLQLLKSGKWTAYEKALPGQASFHPGDRTLRLYTPSGSTRYRGSIGASRYGSGLITVNRVRLDDYVNGVVPMEMPGSWPTHALRAQSIAVRSYVMYEVAHPSALYDICDSTACQVYGGYDREQARVDELGKAVAGKILTYGGSPIFAQFSADDGGWTASGAQPYLIARADPYEKYSDSPWLTWTRTVPVSRIAAYYSLSTVTSLSVTQRDGNGDWAGRALEGVVRGTRAGKAVSVSASGYDLAAAMGLPNWWFSCRRG